MCNNLSNKLENLCIYHTKKKWIQELNVSQLVKQTFISALTNLPVSLKQLNLYNIDITEDDIKIPFGSLIHNF